MRPDRPGAVYALDGVNVAAHAALTPAGIYWPEMAPSDGQQADDYGKDDAGGDLDSHPSKNGGANAVIEGPTVTMYIFDTTRKSARDHFAWTERPLRRARAKRW